MKKILKIRLNPEDAKYGLDTKERRAERFATTGSAFSLEALTAWKAACASTSRAILESLPKSMQEAIPAIRASLPKSYPDAACTRCAGLGYREDKEHWIVIEGERLRGKVCFKCEGSGIEPCFEPTFFRRRVMDSIKQASDKARLNWAERVLKASYNHPYFPVLSDIALMIV